MFPLDTLPLETTVSGLSLKEDREETQRNTPFIAYANGGRVQRGQSYVHMQTAIFTHLRHRYASGTPILNLVL